MIEEAIDWNEAVNKFSFPVDAVVRSCTTVFQLANSIDFNNNDI